MKDIEIISALQDMEMELAALDTLRASLHKRCYQLREKLAGVSTLAGARKGLSADAKARLVANHSKMLMRSVSNSIGTKPVK
jgi:hypothetical protein